MRIFVSYFYNIRFFPKNVIPVSSCLGDPQYFHGFTHDKNYCFVDKRGIMNGIREESLVFDAKAYDGLSEQCQKHCPYKSKVPHCEFMDRYLDQLRKLDYDKLLKEFRRTAEEVRKVTHFEGEPDIAIMVHEPPYCDCAERPCVKQAFKEHRIVVEEWTKERAGVVF